MVHLKIMPICCYPVGIEVNTPDGIMTAHAVLVCVDLPAQAKLLNMKQYSVVMLVRMKEYLGVDVLLPVIGCVLLHEVH